MQAVQSASEVSSARIDTLIGRVRTQLARYANQPQVADFLDWPGQIMATKATGSAVGLSTNKSEVPLLGWPAVHRE